MLSLSAPFPFTKHVKRSLAGLIVGGILSVLIWAWHGPTLSPDLRLVFFPPPLPATTAFRAIILGNAIPVAQMPIPGMWLIHVTADHPENVWGGLVTGVGPFVRLAAKACLSAQPQEKAK